MKLFSVYQGQNNDYDTFSDFVVCAPDEDTARDTSPDGSMMDWSNVGKYSSWALTRSGVEVQYLGEASPDLKAGIICSSFHAG